MKLDPAVFEKMKKLRGSKDPHDVCMLNGLIVLNSHLLLEELIRLNKDFESACNEISELSMIASNQEVRIERQSAALNNQSLMIDELKHAANGQESGSLSEPSEEARASPLSRGVAETAQPLATITNPAGVEAATTGMEEKRARTLEQFEHAKRVMREQFGNMRLRLRVWDRDGFARLMGQSLMLPTFEGFAIMEDRTLDADACVLETDPTPEDIAAIELDWDDRVKQREAEAEEHNRKVDLEDGT